MGVEPVLNVGTLGLCRDILHAQRAHGIDAIGQPDRDVIKRHQLAERLVDKQPDHFTSAAMRSTSCDANSSMVRAMMPRRPPSTVSRWMPYDTPCARITTLSPLADSTIGGE